MRVVLLVAGLAAWSFVLSAASAPGAAAEDGAVCAGADGMQAADPCKRDGRDSKPSAGSPPGASFASSNRDKEDGADAAISSFTATLRLDPKNVPALIGRGAAYKSKGDFKNAFADFNSAIAIEPNNS